MLFIRLFILLVPLSSLAKLPEMQTKQALNNIRFLSNDGKYTYFQQNGKLFLSTNYSSSTLKEGEDSTSYLIFGTPTRKTLIVEKEEDFQRNLSPIKTTSLYSIKYGGDKLEKVAEGLFLSLNLEDTWLTYLDPRTKMIKARSLNSKQPEISVQLKNKINPFFRPQAIMPTKDTLFYTDINSKGSMALLMYSFFDKKFTTVYKSRFTGMNLKFCIQDDNIYLGEFSFAEADHGSSIFKIPLYSNKDFNTITQIYSSQLNDIGNIVCSKENLYFVKTLDENKSLNTKKTEVAKIELKENKLSILTDLRYVTNIINMDGTILVPFREKYFVAEGKSRLNDDKLIKDN
jgi:hypothetical protein